MKLGVVFFCLIFALPHLKRRSRQTIMSSMKRRKAPNGHRSTVVGDRSPCLRHASWTLHDDSQLSSKTSFIRLQMTAFQHATEQNRCQLRSAFKPETCNPSYVYSPATEIRIGPHVSSSICSKTFSLSERKRRLEGLLHRPFERR